MDLEYLKFLIESRTREPLSNSDERELAQIEDLLLHPDVTDYLRCCLPRKPYIASGVSVNNLGGIVGMMHAGASPGGYIRPYGYVVVADSVGGNVICFQASTGRAFWADHESFLDQTIAVRNRSTEDWEFLKGYSARNVQRAMVPLADDIESFLVQLLNDKLERLLDELE